jgi:hypothetical protein
LIPTGLLHWLLTGVDLGAVLLLPAMVLLAGGPATVTALVQAAVSVAGFLTFMRTAAAFAWRG